ncbi:unnamed protein product [Clonostachys rosea]|uniref:Uncharacterized protein n=1 Tax=Bionectria ochroleuca TaxID=29856 RepID=A0ABY6V338_BIOOC|nr:unnamed protein product [Clonostachys rosea]
MPMFVDFLAYSSKTNRTLLGESKDNYFRFDMQYPSLGYKKGHGDNITCVAYAAEYSVSVEFSNNMQAFNTSVRHLEPLNATMLPGLSLMSELYQFQPNEHVSDDFIMETTGMRSLKYTYSRLNMRSIIESLLDYALGGSIIFYEIGQDQILNKTLILQSPQTTENGTHFATNFAAHIVEELLHNVTISMLSYRNTTILANATQTLYENIYYFQGRRILLLSYSLPMGLALIFVCIGLSALSQNGNSANVGGFLQLLCTTTGDCLAVNRLASRCTNGGKDIDNEIDELKKLKVRFGPLLSSEDGINPRMGFGTEEELQ